MQGPEPVIIAHAGTLSGLSAGYLPAWYVEWVERSWHLIAALAWILPLAALAVALIPRAKASASAARIVAILLATATASLAIMLHRFADEVFINFRQALILSDVGRYSFLEDKNIDGSVDLVFYVALGLLHRLGIDIALGALLGGCLAVGATVFLVTTFTFRQSGSVLASWLAGIITMCVPALTGVGGAGWSSAIIGVVTAASICAWYSRRWSMTFVLLASLPLLRVDFIFYTVTTGGVLVAIGARVLGRDLKALVRWYAMTLAVCAAVVLFWKIYYGHVVPTPMLLKTGHAFELDGLLVTCQAYVLPALRQLAPLVVLALGMVVGRDRWRATPLWAWMLPASLHFAAVALHGGDHHEWHRYHTVLFVACAFAMGLGLSSIAEWASGFPRLSRGPWMRAGAAVLLVTVAAGAAAAQGMWREATLANGAREFAWFGAGVPAMTSSRITSNMFTSRFFSWLTDGRKDASLASLENGSIWYAYTGRPVELLGWTDRTIAAGPRNPKPAVGSVDSRLDLAAWERERPQLVWLDTQAIEETQFDPDAIARGPHRSKAEALLSFVSSSRHWWWTQPYFASRFLLDAYEARLTTVNGKYRILWLVRADVAASCDRRLEQAGFSVRR